MQGILTVGYAVLLFLLFDMKSRREECWLAANYPDYPDYQKRVRRLIPFLYWRLLALVRAEVGGRLR